MSMWIWDYLKRPKRNEVVNVPPTRPALNLDVLPSHRDTAFDDLVREYDAMTTEYPHLESVVIAQWGLESGWGTSKLAREAKNHGGAKWRAWMKEFNATPVQYDAWDGEDTYASFKTHGDFIRAYWARFDRISAYSGWRSHTDTPERFMAFIGPIWVGVSKEHGQRYVKNILRIDRDVTSKIFNKA